jgi:hypothetical protein
MATRADFALALQLEQVLQEAVAVEVKDAIAAVLRHMGSGKSRNRRAGQTMVTHLEIARLRASEEAEWHVVRLLQDSLDYATGRILQPDFEERFRLFQDGARHDGRRKFVANMMSIQLQAAVLQGRDLLTQNGSLTADGLLNELEALGSDAKFLEAPEDRPGRYRILRGRAERALWVERVLRERIDVEHPEATAARIVTSPQAVEVLANDVDGQVLLRALELKQRSDGLKELRTLIGRRSIAEGELQRALEDQLWIFGGRYVGKAGQRRLVPGDEVDIPLIRGDGSLHIVELKRAMGVPIVKRHRGALVPTAEVHNAIAQAMNYLVGLDENRQRIHDEFGIEARRASAVVLIGHPGTHPDLAEESITEALRTFNTHLSRVEVLTYKELVDSAQRSLES